MTVHRMLKDAVRWGRIARNPADMSDPPRSATRTPIVKAWTAATLRTFLELTRGDELWALWLVMATTGLRRGEALGLRWADIDFDTGRVRVTRTVTAIGWEIHHGQPKTAAGRRPVALDSATVATRTSTRRQSPSASKRGHRTPADHRQRQQVRRRLARPQDSVNVGTRDRRTHRRTDPAASRRAANSTPARLPLVRPIGQEGARSDPSEHAPCPRSSCPPSTSVCRTMVKSQPATPDPPPATTRDAERRHPAAYAFATTG